MEPELAIGLPAAGSICAAVLKARPRAAFTAATVLGLLGLIAVVFSSGRASNQLGISLSLSAGSRALLIASVAALLFTAVFAPPASAATDETPGRPAPPTSPLHSSDSSKKPANR